MHDIEDLQFYCLPDLTTIQLLMIGQTVPQFPQHFQLENKI